MSSNLVFFNKEGDYLNFQHDKVNDLYTGDLIFNENSSDTFKTIGLYIFEKVPAFEYQVVGELALDKFQLFNEYGFNFSGNAYQNEVIDSIETINNNPDFFSKWIYGQNFESKFPVGTQLIFNSPIFEFTSINNSYTVVSSKKNAVMIISSVDNATFNTSYSMLLGMTSSYDNKFVSGINSIGVYNYIDSSFNRTISAYSEPNFYTKYYNGKKLNFIHTEKNDGVVSIINKDLLDNIYFKYELPIISITSSLVIEVVLKTDLPLVYSGGLSIHENVINFTSTIPSVLKPGREFSIDSNINSNFITVGKIDSFIGNTQLTFYNSGSQVLWNNNTYQCINSYTQSATSSVTPDDNLFWTKSITYIPVNETLTPELLNNAQIHLTTNRLYYSQSFTQSSSVTLASAAEKFREDFKIFNINLYFKDSKLHSDLLYSSKYVVVNYYKDSVDPLNIVGGEKRIYENQVQVSEVLKPELNKRISSNFVYDIVFTDIDDFGIIVKINGMVYQAEIDWVYVGLHVDMERTIDKTLRNWLVSHFARLTVLGVKPSILYLGNFTSTYFNSIVLKSEYPNVPIDFTVEVGTTANYHLEHSTVLFTDIGNQLSITINNKPYVTIKSTDINNTLINWVSEHKHILDEYGILVSSINNLLIFNIKGLHIRLNYNISVGKSFLPGLEPYKITNKILGSEGSLITSNEIVLPPDLVKSFEEDGFATGMVLAINNTINPIQNQNYNILHLTPGNIVLSYQGPFWKTKPDPCDVSPFVTLAYGNGYSAHNCPPVIVATASNGLGGPFDAFNFDPAFSIILADINNYSINEYVLGTANLVDIKYIQISNDIYTLGNDVIIIDALSGIISSTITLPGNTNSITMSYNQVNNYLYNLTSTSIYVVDPLLNSLVNTINIVIGLIPYDCVINSINGDVYVTYSNSNRIDIWISSNLTSSPSFTIDPSASSYRMVFNSIENSMYVTLNSGSVLRIDGITRSIHTTYLIPGLIHSMFYGAFDGSVYVFGNNLYKIKSNIIYSIPLVNTGSFNEILFNNISGNISISQGFGPSQSNYTQIDLSDNIISSAGIVSHGYMVVNQFDGDIYLSSQNSGKVLVINSVSGAVRHVETVSSMMTRMIYDPLRKSIWGIQPGINSVAEVVVDLGSVITINPPVDVVYDGQMGSLSPDHVPKPELWLKTREYIRRPRENFEGGKQVSYIWKWLTDERPEIFMYDFSGNQLSNNGPLTYIGPKPLDLITLNRFPNKDLNRTNLSEFQQTIFDVVKQDLDFLDSTTNVSFMPEPMEIFIGFNTPDEGPISSNLCLLKREDITFDIISNLSNNNIIEFKYIDDDIKPYGQISLSGNSSENFIIDILNNKRGLKVGHHIKIKVTDNTNSKNKHISFNNGKVFRIREIYNRIIVVDFLSDIITDETTLITDYPTVGKITYMNVNFHVEDREIGRFNIFGQTEIEDIRYKIELTNTGHNVTADDIFIFRTYDINEQGVDWGFLNKKRKEMLNVRNDIFSYVGSYKAIINAINYFGYNDLELYEYYRNVNTKSVDFQKLFKVEIPDIFDNSVEGWHENDFLKHTMPNINYEDTNLFNLTYKITDKQGNNILLFSLNEVIIKLQGLKGWLQSNVIPITHKILDITGRADFLGGVSVGHKSYDTRIFRFEQDMTPVDFKINEAYLMPINSGSSVYNVVLDFYVENSNVPDYFSIKIRTYKTYPEWNPFSTYSKNENVYYYGNVYESVIDGNYLKNPRVYENVVEWNMNTDYTPGVFVNFDRNIFEFIGTQSLFVLSGTNSNTITPPNDTTKWLDITEWKLLDLSPVQTIKEFRSTSLLPFSFTVDSNIDPFVVVEVTSDNGYGQIYTSRKNYEIRGLRDITTPSRNLDILGPFTPIKHIP
jgi:hypothetical protein